MATSYSITDGTTTVQLNTGSVLVTEYNMTQEDGSESTGMPSDSSVSESMTLLIVGADAAAVRTAVRGIEALIITARRRGSKGVGVRVYMQAQYDGDAQAWRSELYDGRLVIEQLGDDFWRGKVEANFSFVRSRIWEGAEVELPISANGYAAATGGRIITNTGDSNWIEVAGAQVDGTMPALVRLRLQNTTGGARYFDHVYVGNNAFASPSTFQGYIQGEAVYSGSTYTGSSESFGGGGATATINTAQTIIFKWRFTTTQMAAAGRWFNLIGRCTNAPTGAMARVSVWDYTGLIRLWRGGDIAVSNTGLVNFGAIPIPPGAYGTDYAVCSLVMEGWTSTGSGAFSWDYFGLLGTDSYRDYAGLGLDIANNDYIEFDEINRRYHAIISAAKYPIFAPFGTPLVIFPGVANRLTIMHCYSSHSVITDTLVAQLYYRPARLTV